MNIAKLHKKLTNAARLQTPDECVPYAFEKRIMALIAERTAAAQRNVWVRGLWRAAVSCVAVAILFGVVSLFVQDSVDINKDLSQDFENTLLASADQPDFSQSP